MTQPSMPAAPLVYPQAERLDLVEDLHGHQVADPYRWLEDAADPRTQAWSDAQDELVAEAAPQWPGRAGVIDRLTELLGSGVVGVPIWRGNRRFFIRREGGQEHGVLYVIDGGSETGSTGSESTAGEPEARVLLDPMELDPTGLTTLDAWQPDRDGTLLAYQVSEGGTEESVLRVIDVATGELVDGPIDRARYSPVCWIPGGVRTTDDSGVTTRVPAYYYVRRLAPDLVPDDEQQYHRRVWLHRLGTDPATDVEIFGSGHDPRTYYGVGLSRNGHWLIVSAAVGTAPRNDVWIADLRSGGHQAPPLLPLAVGLDAQVGAYVGRDGRLYIATDLDAPRGRLAVTDPSTPGPENWRDLIGHDPEAVLEDFTVLDGPELDSPLLLAGWTRHAVSEISVHDLDSGCRLRGDRGQIKLPGIGSIGGLLSRPEGGHEAWFSYTDHVTPPHVYRYDGRAHTYELFSSPPGTVEVPGVVTQQITYTSADGTPVRMFVTARADLLDLTDGDGAAARPTAPRPTILYGYGGFNVPLTPGYSANILAWAEAGGIYAVANLRGGSEEGEDWHRAGMLANKQNVFDDFHAAAEHLIADGWTTSDQLAISGGSNGGLLVGAALTQRPELFAAVVCSAPLLDMVRYEKFGLGATWNVEYGSADDAEQFGWLLGYSPYHRVREGVDYPATLFTVFDGDSRVDPLHARKLCAALQHASSGNRPILLRLEKDVGHGARAMSKTIALAADSLTFAAAHTGLPLA
jgi:prolyl oligopeptidase